MSLPHADPAMLAQAAAAQRQAFQPTQSVWVAAHAGTGKTTVLTRRILALLLADPSLQPREILALTFTRAAAAEMAERLPKLLASWAACDEATLQVRIPAELGIAAPPQAQARLGAVRAQLAQQPPLITTLHGFAQHLLAALPAAAGLPEGFGLLDEVVQNRLLQQVQQRLLRELPTTLAPYLATLLDELGEHGWEDLTQLMLANWWRLEERLAGQGVAGIQTLLQRVERQLALPPPAELFAPLQPTPAQAAGLTARGFAVGNEADWLAFLLTKLEPRKRLLTKAEAAGLDEAFLADLATAAGHASRLKKARKAWRGLQLTEALLTWAATVQAAYAQEKQQRGVLDFADLLRGLQHVLQQSEQTAAAAWLWHRLDRRFKHLVVDEAQDNNAAQGAIVQWLATQLLAGEVGSAPRTVLAVGDVKQSVYRFQGAQPAEFYALRDTLADLSPAEGFRPLTLATTFRNGASVLDVVNAVFTAPMLAAAVQGASEPWPTHQTVQAQRPSRVELWPLVGAAAAQEVVGPADRWPLAPERVATQQPSPKLRCLQQVVAWLQAQQAAGVVLPSTGQPLAWPDVLVVARTNATARLVAGLLRRAGIPVAAPRGEPPPMVQDVAALLRVAYAVQDNLALAQVLKGLEGWNDAQLLALAAQAGDGPWLAVLPAASGVRRFLASLPQPCPPAVLVQAAVAWWGLDLAQFTPLLGWAEGAAAAPDPAWGALGTLVQRLETEELPVVTQPGVRVLTLHTAKGLEAPLVILPDTGEDLVNLGREKLLWGRDLVLFKQGEGVSALEDALLAETAAAAAADSLRALYVALTRAADWLVIAGWEKRKNSAGSPDEA
ncbi:MAG: UvrD-helicase domain-containing protein [Alphaproteobacteria bacterium]|jgi:ATP-dependent helicase/nuclease subunit A|nr:UvrD-helicase domain-containing protein [Alphaproteobacteria bacterium]